jgi:hypothetical protein
MEGYGQDRGALVWCLSMSRAVIEGDGKSVIVFLHVCTQAATELTHQQQVGQ